jgi:quercetin 2,3-dioxygenase
VSPSAAWCLRSAPPGAQPILMLDHFGPAEYGPGEAVGAPDHPHRGQETVTYMLQGEFEHKDSYGNSGTLRPGWAQWMTAGRGLVHSEMPSAEIIEKGGTVEGFQLWVNLPAKDKMCEPRYQDTPPERMPLVPIPGASEGSTVRVIAGESCGGSAVIETKIPVTYLDVTLASPGDKLEQAVPEDHATFVYVFRESALLGADKIAAKEGQIAEFAADGNTVVIEAPEGISEPVRALVLAARPIKEPVVQYGPFVMNTREEIMQAVRDFQAGKMGSIPGERTRSAQTSAARAAQKRSGRWREDDEEL